MNLELALTDEMLGIAERIRPADVCLVPERRAELTTEGGLNLSADPARLRAACQRLGEAGIRVSLFIDPEPEALDRAAEAGAPVVELHTGCYADARGDAVAHELARLQSATQHGHALGLQVNAGHGLHRDNLAPVVGIAGLRELNIGHAIIARAVFVGLDAAVREVLTVMRPRA